MCGIGGYHVSEVWCNKWITDTKVMERVLKEAWFHNIHRGYEAAGFFVVDEDKEIYHYKSPGHAEELFEIDIEGQDRLPISTILGAHTRQPTPHRGDPKDNDNNHPVIYRGCYTIHNGHINNDLELRKKYRQKKEIFPQVDSIAISLRLSDIDPREEGELIPALEELEGNFAFHTIWEKYPDLSLLVRGNTSPLVVARHRAGAIFYGSTKEAVWHMIQYMDINPRPEKGWTYRSMDSGTYILIDNGRPLKWGTFKSTKPNVTVYGNKLNYEMIRWLPREGNRKRQEVYRTDSSYDYVNKEDDWSLFGKEIEPDEILYTRSEGPKIGSFPRDTGESNTEAVLCEADLVVENGGLVHAFFGNIEIVMTNGRVLKDVLDHDRFKNGQRWTKAQKPSLINTRTTAPAVPISFDDFFLRKTTSKTTNVTNLPKETEQYKYILLAEAAKKKEEEGDKGKATTLYMGQNGEIVGDGDIIHDDTGYSYLDTPFSLAWEDDEAKELFAITKHVVRHKDFADLIFLSEVTCQQHDEPFSKHDFPFGCKALLEACAWAYSAFSSVDLFGALPGCGAKLTFTFPHDANKKCKNGHIWVESEVVRVYSKGACWDIIMGEECFVCAATRKLDNLPRVVQKLTHSARIDKMVIL